MSWESKHCEGCRCSIIVCWRWRRSSKACKRTLFVSTVCPWKYKPKYLLKIKVFVDFSTWSLGCFGFFVWGVILGVGVSRFEGLFQFLGLEVVLCGVFCLWGCFRICYFVCLFLVMFFFLHACSCFGIVCFLLVMLFSRSRLEARPRNHCHMGEGKKIGKFGTLDNLRFC